MDLIDDVDLASSGLGQVADLVAEVTDVVDAVVARAVDLDDVDGASFRNSDTLVADVTWIGGRSVDTDQTLREQAGGGGLAEPAGATEEVGVMHPIVGDRVAQRTGDMLLTDQVGEGLGAVFPGEDDVGHGAGNLPRNQSRGRIARLAQVAARPLSVPSGREAAEPRATEEASSRGADRDCAAIIFAEHNGCWAAIAS